MRVCARVFEVVCMFCLVAILNVRMGETESKQKSLFAILSKKNVED